MCNADIRLEVAGAGLKLWQIAEGLNTCDSTLSRKLRRELPIEEKARIRSIIKRLKAQQGNDNEQCQS